MAGQPDPSAARHDPVALAAAGRRLAAIDPNRATIGGLRFQLELAMFGAAAPTTITPGSMAAHGPDGPDAAVRRAATAGAPPPVSRADPPTGADASVTPKSPTPKPAAPLPSTAARVDPKPPARPSASETPMNDTGGKDPDAAPPAGRSREPPSTPAVPPASAAPPSSPGGTPDAALGEILAAWPAIVEHLSAHPPTKPLIVKCRPVAVDGAIVTLGFPEEQAFLKDQAERRRPGIEAGIAEVIGHPVTVRCVVANVELATASDDLVAEARRIFAEELADVGEVS
jgi:hypothetical protein